MYMAMARAAATRATCYRLNVGCVVVENRNPIAIGYNGAPRGEPHCTGNGCQYYTDKGCKVIHAEVNALERAERGGQRVDCELYCTHSPCLDCAAVIRLSRGRGLHVGIVYYETEYRDPTPVQTLLDFGIQVFQVLPSGLLVSKATGQLR